MIGKLLFVQSLTDNIGLWLCHFYYLILCTECIYNKRECMSAFHQTEWEISFLTGWTQRRL